MSIYALPYGADLRKRNKSQLSCNYNLSFKCVRLWYGLFPITMSLKHMHPRTAKVTQLVMKFRTFCWKWRFLPFPKLLPLLSTLKHVKSVQNSARFVGSGRFPLLIPTVIQTRSVI